MSENADVTAALRAWRQGDTQGLEQLIPIVYAELRKLARAQLRHESPQHSLQPTALVHELFLKLAALDHAVLESRTHFFAMSARLMRQVLVDHARRKRSAKRGGAFTVVAVDEATAIVEPKPVDILALDGALDELATFDSRQRDIVDLRYFGGLSIEEAAAALHLSTATVEREWTLARAWLYRRLSPVRSVAES